MCLFLRCDKCSCAGVHRYQQIFEKIKLSLENVNRGRYTTKEGECSSTKANQDNYESDCSDAPNILETSVLGDIDFPNEPTDIRTTSTPPKKINSNYITIYIRN